MLSQVFSSGEGLAYLSTGKAYHGLHHGHPLSVLQPIEGAVVLKGRQVLFPPCSCHLFPNFGLHLIKRENFKLPTEYDNSTRACNFKTFACLLQPFCDKCSNTEIRFHVNLQKYQEDQSSRPGWTKVWETKSQQKILAVVGSIKQKNLGPDQPQQKSKPYLQTNESKKG
jgi:hypothetical protein